MTFVLSSVVPQWWAAIVHTLIGTLIALLSTLGIPKLVRALHASRLPCHKLAEGWGREEWGIGNWIFLVSKNLGDAVA